MTFLYRCKHRIDGKQCNTRRQLPKLHTKYVRAPKCYSCGTLLTYRDKWQEKKNKLTTCHCDGEPYPHRVGSTVWCHESKTLPTEEDYRDRHGEGY